MIEKGKFKPAALPELEEELHHELNLVCLTDRPLLCRRLSEGGNVRHLL
jgi:hypothetical protein